MNEEERINRSIKYIINQNYVDTEDDIIGILIKALNLIKKQSKEIEELKDFITKLQATKDRLDSYDKEKILKYEVGFYNLKNNLYKLIEEELPDDELCDCCSNVDVNGVRIKQKLLELLNKGE